VPLNPDDGIIDRQDEWKYQNSITGEWYYWRTIYNKQNNDTEWRVKWLNVVPTSSLGVIVYLTTRNELDSLNKSLLQLSRLLSNHPRPVVIFHEGDLGDNDTQKALAQTLGSRTPLAFERIQFFNNTKGPWLVHRQSSSKYLHMCRFFILMLPNHPLLTLFSFYWRLDAHSYIFAPQPIKDPFEIMQKKQIQYAFVMVNEENHYYAIGLWSLFHKFINRFCLKPSEGLRETQTGWFGGYSLAIVYTNFAIANVSLFRDHPLMRAWLHTVDRNGGIYRYRWGDAPVHTLVVSQFLERDQILRLRYFGYMHRHEYVCASGVEGGLCREQVQPFITNPKINHNNYQDGCCPSTRNPLCHYYPEIRL
jgi:alpha 1,2-mannosyltransferase